MPQLTKWEMLIPQPTNTVHNLIRNPSFEYTDTTYAGTHQYWWAYDGAGTRISAPFLKSTNWAALGRNSLALPLDGANIKHAEYAPRISTFQALSYSVTPTLTLATDATYASTVYPTGYHYVCVFLLTNYGSALASPNEVGGQLGSARWIDPQGNQMMDLLRGRSKAMFSAGYNVTSATPGGRLQVSFSNPYANEWADSAGNSTAGYAVFWSRPNDTAPTGERTWRCVIIRPLGLQGATLVEYLPQYDAATGNPWERGATTFWTNNVTPTTGAYAPTNYYMMQDNGSMALANYIGIDASAPFFSVTPSGSPWNMGTTYSHHLYIEWYVDTNYTDGVSPEIVCACDYAITFIDNVTGTTYTPINPDTGNNRLAATPTDRATAVRTGRTKLLLAPPNNATNVNAGLDLRLRISYVNPSTIDNAAVLYIDNVQFVDIRYKGQDSLDWDDVEFTYFDGDVAGGKWEDFAPSYGSVSNAIGGTTIGTLYNGDGNYIYPTSVWVGTSSASWGVTFSRPNRSVTLNGSGYTINAYGGTTYQGYAQSAMKTMSNDVGCYYPIDSDHLGGTVNVTTTGVGMPEIVTTTQAYGVIDGGMIQRQVANMRTMQLNVTFTGSSQVDLHDKRRRFINALKFDQLSQQGDRIIRYSGSGTPVLYQVTYTAGLEFTGNVGASFAEETSIQFTCADPFVYAERPVGTYLTLQGYTQDTRSFVAYKQGDNQPWVYTGVGVNSDFYQGAGTIANATSAGPTAQSANGFVYSITQLNTTMTLSLVGTSPTITMGAAFFFNDARDIGRPVYAKTAVGSNLFLVGYISTTTSTTVGTLTDTPIGGYVAYTAGLWWIANKYVTNSVGTLAATTVGQLLCIGAGGVAQVVLGKIAAVAANQITLENFFYSTIPYTSNFNVAATGIVAGQWFTVGYATYGTVATVTGTGTAFIAQQNGLLVYNTTPKASPIASISWNTTGVNTTTSVSMNMQVLGTGTISMVDSASGTLAVQGDAETKFTSADIGKLLCTQSGVYIGIISAITSPYSGLTITAGAGGGLPLGATLVPAGTKYLLMSVGTLASTAYYHETPPLNWSGGYFKYHLGFIQSSVSNSVAMVVGGFDNGFPTPGIGMGKYLSIIDLDGTQNITAGNVNNPTSVTMRNTSAGTTGVAASNSANTTLTFTQNLFWPTDVNVDVHTASAYIGTIKQWTSTTTATLWSNATATSAAVDRKYLGKNVVNPNFSSVRPLVNQITTSSNVSGFTFLSLYATGPVTAIHQESPFSLLIAGSFASTGVDGTPQSGISLIRVRGWERRTNYASNFGAPFYTAGLDVDIEIITTNTIAGWGTPTIHVITTDLQGNIYVGGENFTTSHIWYIGKNTDGTFSTITVPLGTHTSDAVIALITDTKFPVPNVFIGTTSAPFLRCYPYWNPRSSLGTWYTGSTITFNNSFIDQAPNDAILQFMRTASGDILCVGAFGLWGATSVYGIARLVPKVGTSASDNPVFVSGAVPAGGSFSQPGVSGDYVGTIADYSYSATNNAYSGTGERIAFGGYFDAFLDGRPSLGLGYLEGSGTASSVRRMVTSDMGLEAPSTSANYPVIQRIATTSRNRQYYSANQVTQTDGLVGPTIGVIMTQANGAAFNSGDPVFRSGYGGSATPNATGVPQMVNVDVNVRGNANVYPVIVLSLTYNTSVYEIIQTETGARIRFDDVYGLRGISVSSGTPEVVTIDLRPGYRSVRSNLRGSLMQFVAPESNFGNFYLLAPFTVNTSSDTTRTNTLMLRYSTVTTATSTTYPGTVSTPSISILYTPRFWSFDVSPLYKDGVNVNLL